MDRSPSAGEIRRIILATPGATIQDSAAEAGYSAALAAQEAGAHPDAVGGILATYAIEWRAIEAELATLEETP